jgi:hypothetical protein
VRDDKGESNLGDWVTDAMRGGSRGGLRGHQLDRARADIDAGPLTFGS